MLIVLAANSSATSDVTIQRGSAFPMFQARPWSVTRPIRALTSCTAVISG